MYKLPPMVGGIKYEHAHRMIAEFIGLLIIIMAVWTQRVEQRKWMRVWAGLRWPRSWAREFWAELQC